MVSTREPFELSPSSERRYSLQRFIPHVSNKPKPGSFKFPQTPNRDSLQAFDSALHKELCDNAYKTDRPKPVARSTETAAQPRDPSIIVSIRHYHIMLKSLEESPESTPRNSWVYEQPKLKTTGCCLLCRKSFSGANRRICSMCAAIKSAYEYHDMLRPKSSCTLNYVPRSTPRQSWVTQNSIRPSTISWGSGGSSLYRTETSSTYQSPTVCVLISRSQIRFFPGLSHQYILDKLSSAAVDIIPMYREHKPNHESSSDADGRSISDSLGPKRSSKIAKSTRSSISGMTGTSSSSNNTTASSARKRTKKRNTSTRFGCPFAKRNPSRYERVIGSCTMPRGMEMKYIVEHLDRTHSGKISCPYCHEKWNPNISWVAQLHEHTVTSPCLEDSDMLCEPEALNEVQQAALDLYKSERHTEPETQRWVNLFMALFPDEFPIPNPYYDFYTPTHLVRPRASSQQGSISSSSLAQLPSSDSTSTLRTASESTEPTQIDRDTEQSIVEPKISTEGRMSPMLLATTSMEELEPSFEPLDFEAKLPSDLRHLHQHAPNHNHSHSHNVNNIVPLAPNSAQAQGYMHHHGSTGPANAYDSSAETMVSLTHNHEMLPSTFGQMWTSNVGDLDNMGMGYANTDRYIQRPGAGQDSGEFFEMQFGQFFPPQHQ